MNFSSLQFLRDNRQQFHSLLRPMSEMELEELEESVGRDDGVHHKSSVNVLLRLSQTQFLSGGSDCWLKLWSFNERQSEFAERAGSQVEPEFEMLHEIKTINSIMDAKLKPEKSAGHQDLVVFLH